MMEQVVQRDTPGLTPTMLVNEHWPAVYRWLYSITGNCHDTEDLTQETFLRALKRLDSLQPGTKARAWLLKIAANAYFDVYRKRQILKVDALPADLTGPPSKPEQALELAEQDELLSIALRELSETTRAVFHLRAAEELSFRDIGDVLGLTEETARWYMYQARTRLLGLLSEKL